MPQFLSDEWLAAAREIYASHEGSTPPATQDVQINVVVTGAPFGDGTVQAHLDTAGSEPGIGAGHIDGATTTITTDYETAKSVFIGGDQSAAMQAFMGGKVQITGDMTKVMMLMQATPDPSTAVIAEELMGMTD